MIYELQRAVVSIRVPFTAICELFCTVALIRAPFVIKYALLRATVFVEAPFVVIDEILPCGVSAGAAFGSYVNIVLNATLPTYQQSKSCLCAINVLYFDNHIL